MKEARIYVRRSDDDQSTWSPAAQERECREYCREKGYHVVDVYLDDDLSGTRADRPSMARLVQDARADPGSVVIVHKFDRLARDAQVLLKTIYKDLHPKRVTVESVMEKYDVYTPTGKMMVTLSGGVAAYYSDNLRTEVLKGLREKFTRGGALGPVSLGYAWEYDRAPNGERIKSTGRMVRTADASTVVRIFELYATGNQSDMTIAEELNRRGLMTLHKGRRVPFQKDSIKSILTNPIYLGMVRHKDEHRRGNHDPLIDRSLWEQCQEIRARRSAQRGGRLPVRGVGSLLSELGYCGACGARLHTHRSGAGNSRYLYYRCSQQRRFGMDACNAPMVRAESVEPAILDMLRGLSLISTLRDAVIAEVQRRVATPAPVPAQINHDTIQRRLKALQEEYLEGNMERSDYLKRRAALEQQRTATPPQPPRVLDLEKAIALLGDMRRMVDTATPEQRRALLQTVVKAVWVTKDAGVRAIQPAPAYALLVANLALLWAKRPRLETNPTSPHTPLPPLWNAFQTPMGDGGAV